MERMADILGRVGASVRIFDNVTLGSNVTIGDNTIIYENVRIGDGSFIGANCILGEPLAAFYGDRGYQNPPLTIGRNSIVRSGSILYAGSILGDHLQTGHRVTIRECSDLGVHCMIGTLSDIQGFVRIGNYCRCHSNVHIGQRSTLKDYVWIYPYAVLTNDPHPPSECIAGPTIEEYAVVATGAIIMPRIVVGRDAVVGAQALVNKDVPPRTVVAGVPARTICSIDDVMCKEGKVGKPYPWRYHYSKGYPWEAQQLIPEE